MNSLNTQKRCQIIAALVEGNSINSTSRMTGVCKEATKAPLTDAAFLADGSSAFAMD